MQPINGYITRAMLLLSIIFHLEFINDQIFLWKPCVNIWKGLKMKTVKLVLSMLPSIAFIVTFSDLLQYLLLFPVKSIQAIFVLSIVSLILLLVSIYLLKEPKKYHLIKVVLAFLLVSLGFYERIYSANELSVAVNSSKLVLNELKPKLKKYVERQGRCPRSLNELLLNNESLIKSILHNYVIKNSDETCYVVTSHFGSGTIINVEFPEEDKLIYMRKSAYWTFILNDLIYYLSFPDETEISFGIKISKPQELNRINGEQTSIK